MISAKVGGRLTSVVIENRCGATSIAVVQRVRSNIWHFKFEMPTYGGSNQLFMKNRSDYHDHQDIYIYNPSCPKRFTLDVPNQGDYSDGICQTSRQDESWRCSDCNTNSQHFSWLQKILLLYLTGRRIVTTLFDLNKMFQTPDWNYFVKQNYKSMLDIYQDCFKFGHLGRKKIQVIKP